jgi:hypothetical protein
MSKRKVIVTPPLPKSIYVKREVDGDDSYLVTFENLEDATLDDADLVGIYELTATKTLRVTRSLE